MMEASLIKSGELCMRLSLSRSALGLKVNVKVSPLIENFMRSLGTGDPEDVTAYGRLWLPEQETMPLKVWNMGRNPMHTMTSNRYSIAMPGSKLDLTHDVGPDAVNLSMLRLVGASEGDGVTFHIKGSVHSLDGLRDLKNKLGAAGRNLYVDYIKPVDLTVYVTQISSQEV